MLRGAGAAGAWVGAAVNAETWVALAIAAALAGYLLYALLHPERF
ncbi:hypothetical protein CELD12_24490 [Cellulomonas sp. NTE-D12]|nr:hypothetical protein CELD12_24490 [Cellulomonas sp. NTE-D12]